MMVFGSYVVNWVTTVAPFTLNVATNIITYRYKKLCATCTLNRAKKQFVNICKQMYLFVNKGKIKFFRPFFI